MDQKKIDELLSGLDAESLGQLDTAVREARNRSRAVDLDSISAASKPEEIAAYRAEVNRILAGG